MRSLLIGHGQEFILVKQALIGSKNKIKVIGNDEPEHLVFKTKAKKPFSFKQFLKGRKLDAGDLKRIDSVFISVYDREFLKNTLKILSELSLSQPVFVLSTAISEHLKSDYPKYYFFPIQKLFRRQTLNILAQCDFLFRVQKLKSLLKAHEKVLIIIFENPDPDAIASALALATLFSKLKVKSQIAYTGQINRLQNRALIEELGKEFHRIDEIDITEFDKLATVDAQPYFFQGKFKFDIVIDHHPRRERCKASFSDIRTRMGATSTIMTQYLLNSRIGINKKLATALLYGIKIDTNNLEQHVQDEDIRTFRFLYSRADHDLLKRIELSEIPREALPYFEYALKNKKLYKDRVYVNLGKVEFPEVHVMVADFLLRVERVSTVIVSSIYNHTLIIVFRNDGYGADLGRLASLAFEKFGHAGGHKYMARAEIPCHAIKRACKSYSKRAIDGFIFRQINKVTSDV